MSASEAIIVTFAVIAGIILVMFFHEAISGFLIMSAALVALLLVVSGVVGGIIMIVLAVKENDVGLGVGGTVITCACIIILDLVYVIGGFEDR